MKQLIKLMAVFCLFTMSMPVMANDFSHNDTLVFCSGNCGGCNKPCGGHGNGGCDGDCDDKASLSESTMVFCGGHCGGCNKPCGGHGNGGCGGDKDDNTDN